MPKMWMKTLFEFKKRLAAAMVFDSFLFFFATNVTKNDYMGGRIFSKSKSKEVSSSFKK